MIKKRGFACYPAVVFFVLLLAAPALAQMTPIYRFRAVNVPLNLTVDDKTLEKGVYDLEFLRTSSPVIYYMRIMKKGKILGLVQGEEWPYGGGIPGDVPKDATIPDQPALKMSIDRNGKLLFFTFESGRYSLKYPMVRARYKLPYVD